MASVFRQRKRPSPPYREGAEFTIHAHTPPPPFGDRYNKRSRVRKSFEEPEFQSYTGRLDFALAHPPVETPPPAEVQSRQLTILDPVDGHEDSHKGVFVVRCVLDSDPGNVYIGKIYDGVRYPSGSCPYYDDCMYQADLNYANEATAYQIIPLPLQGAIVPRYFGSWTFCLDVPERPGCQRWVRMILLEHVEGESMFDMIVRASGYVSRSDLRRSFPPCPVDYSLLPSESERLEILARALEANVQLFHQASIRHIFDPRNILITPDKRVVLVDFVWAYLIKYSKSSRRYLAHRILPVSPAERFWAHGFYKDKEFRYWVPESWRASKDARLESTWLCERYAENKDYEPLGSYFIEHNIRDLLEFGLLLHRTEGVEVPKFSDDEYESGDLEE